MRRWKGLSALVVVLLVTATGCLRAEVGLNVNDDRSGSVDVKILVNKNSVEAAGITQKQLEQLVDAAAKQMPGADVSVIDDRGDRGVNVTVPFEDYQQAIDALTNASFQGQPLHMFQSMKITPGTEGMWTMRAVADPVGIQAIIAEIPKFAPVPPLDPQDAEINFSVTLPGEVVASNAFHVDGGTAMWKLTGKDAVTELNVRNEPGSLSPLQIVLIGVGGLLVGGFILVLLTAAKGGKSKQWTKRPRRLRRRRRQTADHAEQWQPKTYEPGSLGGRDESVLPVVTASEPVAPPIAPAMATIPPVGPGAMGPPHAAGPGVATAPPTATPAGPAPTVDPAAPVLPPVLAPIPVPVEGPAPQPVAEVPAVHQPPPAITPQQPVVPPAMPPPPMPPVPAVPTVAPVPAAPAVPPAPPAPAVPPAPPAPMVPAVPPAPVAPADAPNQSHWLSPQPHVDGETHWLDKEPDPAEEESAELHLPPPPPKPDHWVYYEHPGDVEL